MLTYRPHRFATRHWRTVAVLAAMGASAVGGCEPVTIIRWDGCVAWSPAVVEDAIQALRACAPQGLFARTSPG